MIKNITFGQYFPVDSVIHKLDPRVKTAGFACVNRYYIFYQDIYRFCGVCGVYSADYAVKQNVG